jgi:hypothetical protein
MQSRTTGRFTLFSDEKSLELQKIITPTGSVKVNNTAGDFVKECVLSYFQCFPALYKEVVGMTIETVLLSVETFDIPGPTKEYAKAAISDEYLNELVKCGFLRKEIYEDKCIYFPTEIYLKNCGLIDESRNPLPC